MLLVGAGGVSHGGGVGSAVRTVRPAGEGAQVPLSLQWVCVFLAVPFCQGRQPDVQF